MTTDAKLAEANKKIEELEQALENLRSRVRNGTPKFITVTHAEGDTYYIEPGGKTAVSFITGNPFGLKANQVKLVTIIAYETGDYPIPSFIIE